MKQNNINKLDLSEYIADFKNFLARDKELFLEGDANIHKKFIDDISKVEFTPPKETKNLDSALMYIKKQGILKLYEIFEFVKIIWYFNYLKKQNFSSLVSEWLYKIIIPADIVEITTYFDDKANLRNDIDERFSQIEYSLKKNKQEIKESLNRIVHTKKISPYLVDSQIHYLDANETLLVRGGFNHVLKASVVGRSSGGFFYVIPESIDKLKKRQAQLLSQKEELIYEYEKKISSIFSKHWKFLNYINKEFDRFDNYQARVHFAKARDYEFLSTKKGEDIVLKSFAHPALKNPKLLDIDFSKKLLLVTGVNAGGKTMLLKSILSAVFMAKYLLPFQIDANNSKICSFKEIVPIIDDPQSVKNDISTFAGRMSEFSHLFGKKYFIAGVDEIELGTDADEAASLFKVILEKLMKKGNKIVVTTHHKRLASMMATHKDVELLAAIYDDVAQRPTYEFLKGTIGKSYAFETALRYGISASVIGEAKEVYGEDKEKLNSLIQKNIDLELEYRAKLSQLEIKSEKVTKLKESLTYQKQKSQEELRKIKSNLEKEYNKAINEAKEAAKANNKADIHRLLNKADKKKKEAKKNTISNKVEDFKVGDRVKYRSSRGEIVTIRGQYAFIKSDGISLKVPLKELKRSGNPPKPKQKTKIDVQRPSSASVQLDLHGLRSEEAIEKLDSYLSDALITGYDEVLIYHGVGTGKLAFAVKEFLKRYPKVKSFTDAPANMGGMGATLVKL